LIQVITRKSEEKLKKAIKNLKLKKEKLASDYSFLYGSWYGTIFPPSFVRQATYTTHYRYKRYL